MEVLISVENFEDGETAREINSPRSLESCLRSGLDPSELFPKPYEKFISKKLTKEMVEIKYENFEKKRRGTPITQLCFLVVIYHLIPLLCIEILIIADLRIHLGICLFAHYSIYDFVS